MTHDARSAFKHRIRRVPWLLANAPPWMVLLGGLVLTVLGLLIAARPLTSLVLLGIYIGVSCVISGIVDLIGRRAAAPWYDSTFAVLWITAGLAILILLGGSIEILPTFLAILLIISGLGRLTGAVRGAISERVLAVSLGIAEIAFGVIAHRSKASTGPVGSSGSRNRRDKAEVG